MNDIQTEVKVDHKDLVYTYINVLIHRIAFKESKHCWLEGMSGCLAWEAAGESKYGHFDYVFATPFWEDENVIPVQFTTKEGDYIGGEDIPFPMSELTMDLEKDVQRYCETIRNFLKEKYGIIVPPQYTLADI